MERKPKAYLIGAGIGNLAAAAFMIRDGAVPGENILVLETDERLGGSLDASGNGTHGYSMRGGRMLTTDNYECTWDLYKTIPSLRSPTTSVYEETLAFNNLHKSNATARLVDRHRAKLPVRSMGFSMRDRIELSKLISADESALAGSRITDWLSASFFETPFWYMWATTFAFQTWHSATELKRYLHRFLLEFSRIETLAGVKRTVFNQYDSLVRPLHAWLEARGVRFAMGCTVTDLDHASVGGLLTVTQIRYRRTASAPVIGNDSGLGTAVIDVPDGDLVFLQNGSMTDSSSVGSFTRAPEPRSKTSVGGWALWEKLAQGRPDFGNPAAFNTCVAQSSWDSFTVTLNTPAFFAAMESFTGNEAGTGGLVTFKDSSWLLSIVLPHQPHFEDQAEGIQVFWGYALLPDRVGDFVGKAMSACTGEEILRELCGHLRFDFNTFAGADCIPCHMPYITSMFMPRQAADRPLPLPRGSRNLAFVSQFVELPSDVVFTIEYSVRAAQTAVYALVGIDRPIPPVTPHDHNILTWAEAIVKALE